MNDTLLWIWLSLSVTPGSKTFRTLLNALGDIESIYAATEEELLGILGSRCRDITALADKDLSGAEQILKFCTEKSVSILKYCDDEYPMQYREIENPPVLLYYRGVLPDFNRECMIAMVGTRRLTDYGRRNAYTIGYDLASAGAVVLSGMAIGIDGVSHAGALAAGGINVAFLGSGIDVCYPPVHLTLAREIVKNGCIMTEFAPGTAPERKNFPVRNRLIAALACATVVIEGKISSGAIITARHARAYGRAVYALPGNVDNKTSEVANILIQNGAKLIISAVDIIADLENEYLGRVFVAKISPKPDIAMDVALRQFEISCVCPSDPIFTPPRTKKKRSAKASEPLEAEIEPLVQISEAVPDSLDEDTLRIYTKIPVYGGCSINDLVDETDKMHKVMKALLKLEMGRFVTILPGERVKRNM